MKPYSVQEYDNTTKIITKSKGMINNGELPSGNGLSEEEVQ